MAMTEQRRALCCELAEIERMVNILRDQLESYYGVREPTWGHVNELRRYKQSLRELLEEKK